MLATRLIRLLTLTFSRSLDLKNIPPRILIFAYHSRAVAHNIHTALTCSHSRQSRCFMSPTLNTWAVRAVWPACLQPRCQLYSLPGANLLYFAKGDSIASWTGGNYDRLPTWSGAPFYSDSWWTLCPQQRRHQTLCQQGLYLLHPWPICPNVGVATYFIFSESTHWQSSYCEYVLWCGLSELHSL
jgi:hypothetical protein